MRRIYKFLVKVSLILHSLFYKLSSILAIQAEGGLHPKHRLMDYHRFFVANVEAEEAVLDIGCANGALPMTYQRKPKKVVGIDLNEGNLKVAREKFSGPNIKYLVGDVTKNLPARKFDAIILSNVLEHIQGRVVFLQKNKKLAPKILIRVPMINRDWITLYKKELGAEWRSDKTHYIEYTLESFKEELEKIGLDLEKYSIQFGEIWAVVGGYNIIGEEIE